MLINDAAEVHTSSIVDNTYIGEVVDNNDPEKLGRIKVRILDVFGSKMPNDALPWCVPLRDVNQGALANLSGIAIPVVGARVGVRFYNGDIYSPMYSFIPYTRAEVIDAVADNYPNKKAWIDKNNNVVIVNNTGNIEDVGNKLVIDNVANTIDITLFSGVTVHVSDTGSVTVTMPNNSTFVTSDTLTLDSNVHITGQCEIDGSTTIHNTVQVDSTVHADGNISSDGQVADSKSTMDDMRTIYNNHTHPNNGASPPPTKMT